MRFENRKVGKILPLLLVFRLGGENWILSHTDHSDFPSDITAITVNK